MKSAKQLVDELSAAGLTQDDIARKACITQATISRIKAGVSEGRVSNWQRLNELHAAHFAGTSPAEQTAAA